ncbi:formin-like protein 8 [Eucalyptus grandis]|uniref:formin-like protein 8 n=1 Tax=Eucalyptus grandis TaxID=71139 RepID=UPI00192E88A2|nr:formin-like protein 8 [Eucalyptus grandis]
MAASVAGRSAFLRAISRATARTPTSSTPRGTAAASPRPPIRPHFGLPRTPISPPPPPPPPSFRLVRRELSSLLPVHSAVASARLVSKLPSEVNSSFEGRFANYLSPI